MSDPDFPLHKLTEGFLQRYYKTDSSRVYVPDRLDKQERTLKKHLSLLNGLIKEYGGDFLDTIYDPKHDGKSMLQHISDVPLTKLSTARSRFYILHHFVSVILQQKEDDDSIDIYEDQILLDRFNRTSRTDPNFANELIDSIESFKSSVETQYKTYHKKSFELSAKELKIFIPYKENVKRVQRFLQPYGARWLNELDKVIKTISLETARSYIDKLQVCILVTVYGLEVPMRLELLSVLVQRSNNRSQFDREKKNYVYKQAGRYFIKINDYKIVEDDRDSYVMNLPESCYAYYERLYYLTTKFNWTYLFRINERDEIPQSSKRLQEAFLESSGLPLSVDVLRKAWGRDQLESQPYSRKHHEFVAEALKHTLPTNATSYNKDMPDNHQLPLGQSKVIRRKGPYNKYDDELEILKQTRGRLWHEDKTDWRKFKHHDEIFPYHGVDTSIREIFKDIPSIQMGRLRDRVLKSIDK